MKKQTPVAGYLMLLAALLPLKFGAIAGLPEVQAFFPEDWFAYLIILWPPSSLGIAGGVALVLALWAFGTRAVERADRESFLALLLWLGLPVAGLLGFINASAPEFAVLETGHLLGATAAIAAMYLMVAAEGERALGKLLGALAAGTLCTAAVGIEQYFSGFAETTEFMRKQAALYGNAASSDITAMLNDRRVFATFGSCNALAGYLLGAIPPVILVLWQWGKRVEPVRVSRWLFAGLGGAACTVTLLLTRSRAGILAVAATGLVWLFTRPIARKWKILLCALIAGALAAGFAYARVSERGIQSMGARLSYLRSAAIMLAREPFAGSGWGDFFHDHMKYKTLQTKEAAHTPHNLVAAFASQCGAAGLLWSLALVLYPLWALWRRGLKQGGAASAAALGLTLFSVHTMMDIDMQAGANLVLAGLLGCGVLAGTAQPAETAQPYRRKAICLSCPALAAAALLLNWHLLSSEYRISGFSERISLRSQTPEAVLGLDGEAVWRELAAVSAARPYGIGAYLAAGDFYLFRNDLDRAEACFREAVKRAPERPANYQRLGLIELRRNNPEEAEKYFRKTHELFPRNPEYRQLPGVRP